MTGGPDKDLANRGLGNRDRGKAIMARLDALAELSDEPWRITRLYLSPAHRKAVDLVSSWMRQAGMAVHMDATGTVIGRYEAETPGARALILGSHIDSVRDAGRFDGILGVATAVEVVAQLHQAKRRLPCAIEVVAFGDEEGVRFARTLGGSRALAGEFDPAMLDEQDASGVTRRQALVSFGCDPTKIAAAARNGADIVGYIEVHIEQGPVLEAEGLPLGVVTAINGASRGTIELVGVSGHAGTVPMPMRKDALAAASEIVLAIEALGNATADLVATVGRLDVPNSAANTVPGLVRLSYDVRSSIDAKRLKAVVEIETKVAAIARRRGLAAQIIPGHQAQACPCDPTFMHYLSRSLETLSVPVRALPSGAGHDAMAFKGRFPFAMLFVRSRLGISHNPAEFSSVEDIDLAARVLSQAVEAIASA